MTSEVILITATWCSSCKILKKVLDTKNYSIPVVMVDADKNPEVLQKYNARSLPTMIRLDDAVETNRMVGYNANNLEEFFSVSSPG